MDLGDFLSHLIVGIAVAAVTVLLSRHFGPDPHIFILDTTGPVKTLLYGRGEALSLALLPTEVKLEAAGLRLLMSRQRLMLGLREAKRLSSGTMNKLSPTRR